MQALHSAVGTGTGIKSCESEGVTSDMRHNQQAKQICILHADMSTRMFCLPLLLLLTDSI